MLFLFSRHKLPTQDYWEWYRSSSKGSSEPTKRACIFAKSEIAAGKFAEKALRHIDEKIFLYWAAKVFLCFLFCSTFSKNMSHTSRNVLTEFEELVMFLMRMRLAIQLEDLAYRFRMSQPTASRICEKWLDICYDHLSSLVYWPEEEDIMRTMPVCFVENFGLNVKVILDCFELFIPRPSLLLTWAKTCSQYKHHNTVWSSC